MNGALCAPGPLDKPVCRQRWGPCSFSIPAVRYALKQLAMERELACDEHVLASGTEPQLYAEVILKVAERMIGKQMDCPAFGPSQADLQRRIEMILEYRFSKTSGGWYRTTLKAAVVALLAVLLLPSGQSSRSCRARSSRALLELRSVRFNRPPVRVRKLL
jgi:beta-lactamase regulating signal transducer with metallopeptidase domain